MGENRDIFTVRLHSQFTHPELKKLRLFKYFSQANIQIVSANFQFSRFEQTASTSKTTISDLIST